MDESTGESSGDFGAIFRKVREREDISLKEAADALKIRRKYLRAIEQNEFEDLPPRAYSLGFIRNYARYLDLDPEALVMKFKMQYLDAGDSEPAEVEQIESFSWTLLILVVLVVLGVVGFRFLFFGTGRDREVSAGRDMMPRDTAVQEAVPPPAGDTVAEDTRPEKLRLKVRAVDKTWLHVIFDGVRKQERFLYPGDTVTWEAEGSIRLRLGNAGGIELYHRGVKLPSLGRRGEVSDKIITMKAGEIQVKNLRDLRIPPPANRSDSPADSDSESRKDNS